MAQEPMASVDAAWLRMDDDVQRMMITVLLRFEGVLTFTEVARLVKERLTVHRRFRQRVATSVMPGRPAWEEDPHFSADAHLHRVALPAPRDEDALRALVSDVASTPLDERAPLWHLHVVEDAPGGTALIARIHHAVADGVSLVKLLLTITDESLSEAPRVVGLKLPSIPPGWRTRARLAVDHSVTLSRLLTLPADPRTRLVEGPLGRRKTAAWSAPLPLEALREAGMAAGAKVNDVLLSVVGGALRRYLTAGGSPVEGLSLRGLVPVYFQGHGRNGELGNHFGMVFAPLLVGEGNARARLAAVKARMDALKDGAEAMVALEVLMAMGVVGPSAERVGIELFTRKASALVTNVPGPPARLHLAGKRLHDMVVWAPVAGRLGLSVTMLSYAGRVRVGVLADARRLPDAHLLADGVSEDLDELSLHRRGVPTGT